MNQKEKIFQIIISVANEFNNGLTNRIPVEQGRDAPLYGQEGILDSLGFVSFIVAVEQAIEENTGVAITLADEKAMSQRNSPFRTIGTLTDFVLTLLGNEQEKNGHD